MKCSKFFIILYGLFFCCLSAVAQDSEYVYKDSSVIIADSITTSALVVEMKKSSATNEENVVDTVFKNNQVTALNDSAEVLKNASSFAYAKNLDSILQKLQKEQIAQEVPVKNETSWIEIFFLSSVTKLFFWAIAGLFIGFILYKLFFTEGFFQRSAAISKVTILPQQEERLFAATDYNKLIIQSITNKNYRLAIRYHYLQTLQKLSAKGTIQFTADKTNYQYVKELYGKPYRDEFASLTLKYEYAWYGGFDIDETMFTKIQNNFKQFTFQL